MIYEKLPDHDDPIEGYEWGYDYGDLIGDLLVTYRESTYESGDETFVSEVHDAEIIGLHIGGNVVITRDELCKLQTSRAVDDLEVRLAEQRRELI